jgi:tRNA dimethylallyltransferase
VLVVAGPTGSGKSALALDVAAVLPATIVNADSMQVYRELRVLTARPTSADEAKAPHRLFGVLAAAEACSAGRWLRLAMPEIEAAHAAKRLPIVVGGTGLYLKALLEGLAEIPEIPKAVTDEARVLHARLGGAAFREKLAALDPDAAGRLRASDRQRLIRAYAVVRATGRPLADWQKASVSGPALKARFAVVVLSPPRSTLAAALDARFDAMMAAGALDEVRALLALGLDPALPAMKAVGVPELRRFLDGDCALGEAVAAAKQATRNFAKRQMTWLRHQIRADMVHPARYGPEARADIIEFVRRFVAGQS